MIQKQELSSAFPFICYRNRFVLCGQPTAKDLKEFKQKGWTCVVNLRGPAEMQSLNFDMPVTCKDLGLDYYFIPLLEQGKIHKKSLKQIHELFSQYGDQKILVHCASGFRSKLALMGHFILSKQFKREEIFNQGFKLELSSQNLLLLTDMLGTDKLEGA